MSELDNNFKPNKIIIKNGQTKPNAGVLDVAELGFATSTRKLYVGATIEHDNGDQEKVIVPVTGATVNFDEKESESDLIKYFTDAQRLGGLKAENYATKDYVTEKINEASIGGGGSGGGGGSVPVEIEDIVTIDLDGAVEGPPNAINADTLGGRAASEYATESYVDDKISEAQLGNEVDLSEYAKKSEIPDVSAFQTAEQVSSLINEALGVIENGSY